MIEKKIVRNDLKEFDEIKENLLFWLSKSEDERISAVEILRKQYHGDTARLQRTISVFKRP